MIDEATFRADLPEFASEQTYTTSQFSYWLGIGKMMLTGRWGASPAAVDSPSVSMNMYDMALELFIAHNFVLEQMSMRDIQLGNIPGITKGPISGAGSDGVTISYNSQAGLELDGGHWNHTIYGIRLLRMARLVGMGGVYVGGGCDPTSPLDSANAWPGVLNNPPFQW